MDQDRPNIFVLSGAYDDQYRRTRRDNPIICTSAGKRIILYQAIEIAVGTPVVLLSPQPRGRGVAKSLPATSNHFGAQTQLFSKASGIRKIRFLLDFFHYARHVAKHTLSGDTLIIDNYELIYIVAVYYCRLIGRNNPIVLEYEDGKHLIDRGVWRLMSGLAEWLGRPLVQGAILASPALSSRLPPEIPKILVPGILRDDIVFNSIPPLGETINFLYSGSLDRERGLPLLLDYLNQGKIIPNTAFHITGQGHFVERFVALQDRYPGWIHFHGAVSQDELARIRSLCHYGLNLQSSTHPISSVTYPSKTFDYLNAGLRLITTKAAGVQEVLGDSVFYINNETPEGLSDALQLATQRILEPVDGQTTLPADDYSHDSIVRKLSKLLVKNI